MSLTARTTTGILWNLLEQFARRGVSILVTLLLAKFLVPEDFGLVAMMALAHHRRELAFPPGVRL